MTKELDREIQAYIDEHWDDVLADIGELIAVESTEDLAAAAPGAPFGPGPREALTHALAIAGRMGLATHDCEGYVGYADLPGESATQIGIIGHVDVVPAGPGWSFDPFALTRKDGFLIGRGVLDDKGPIMVALHAVKFWADRGRRLPYTIRVLFGANEEANMKDVAYYRAHYDDPAFLFTPDNSFPVGYGESGICSGMLTGPAVDDGIIVEFEGGQVFNAVPGQAHALVRAELAAEAPGITLTPAGDGLTRIDAAGVTAHASTPDLGVNAIGVLVRYLVDQGVGTEEERAFLGLLDKLHGASDGSGLGVACADEHFGALTAVGGVARLSGGRMTQSIDFRYPTTTTSAELEARVNALAQQVGAAFAMEHDKTPFLMDPDSPAVGALMDAYNDVTGENRMGATTKGGTYARCFTTGVSFGVEMPWDVYPDWVGGMHGPDEGVREDLLKRSLAIFVKAIGNLMDVPL